MSEDLKNTGVILSYPKPEDFIFGGDTGVVSKDVLQTADWRLYKPVGRKQAINGFETFYCVTFSAINIIKIWWKFMLAFNLIPVEKVNLLKQWGFILPDGKISISFAYTGKMSGTTTKGNTLQAVWDSIRKDGLVPEEMWSKLDAQDWNEWAAEIPVEVKNFGKNILTIFNFNYEWLVAGNCGQADLALIKQQLKQCPMQIAGPVCGSDASGTVNTCGYCVAQHATTLLAIDDFIQQFDSYEPFDKKLVPSFPLQFLMKCIVSLKEAPVVPPLTPFGHVFNAQINLGETSEEVGWLQKALIRLGGKTYVTKYFGPITQAAVKAFQIKYNLASQQDIEYINGRWVGPATRAKLNELLK